MNMIEVDPKLFVKCRLCLDETGQYQIVPNVQMQIKYCFEIDIEPFDGLPQLICKKCEAILSQYAGIKQIFQEKQKNLKSKLISNTKVDNDIQQQQDTVSSTQADTENRNKIEEITRINRVTLVPNEKHKTRRFSTGFETKVKKKKKTVKIKHLTKAWESNYTKLYVCRYCDKSYKNVKGVHSHIKRCKIYKKYSYINKTLCLVRLNKIGTQTNLTGSNDNVVCNQNRIIQCSKKKYYVIYSKSTNEENYSSESTDEDFLVDKKRRKRQRLISRSSNETVVIESDDVKVAKVKTPDKDHNRQTDSYIECVNLDDSDSNSTKSSVINTKVSEPLVSGKISATNDKMVNNIIAMCLTKYMNRLNAFEEGSLDKFKEESSLKHKVLSIGRKVICNTGTNTTGLLRYMEYKNLEVDWVSKMDSTVIIRTKSKENEENTNLGWENISSFSIHNHKTQDFALDFEIYSELENYINKNNEDTDINQDISQFQGNTIEKELVENIYVGNVKEIKKRPSSRLVGKSLNCEPVLDKVSNQVGKNDTKSSDNIYLRTVLDADKNWKKLLNANPVANPKQLPKKSTFNESPSIVKIYSNELQNDSGIAGQSETNITENDDMNMPVITSTVSLAPVVEKQADIDCYNQNAQSELNKDTIQSKPQSNMPKIKVKPVSELMSEKALSQQNNVFVSTSGWTVATENQHQNMLQTNASNMIYIASDGIFKSVIPIQQNQVFFYPQLQNVEAPPSNSIVNRLRSKKEFLILHTVELPNSRTDSPFRYLQKLLQIHNIILHDFEEYRTFNNMECLIKFKVVFEQDTNSPIKLCLSLYSENNKFLIQVTDDQSNELDLSQFSAHWQWEILRVFKGEDIVSKVISIAMKMNVITFNYASYLMNLIKSIIVAPES